MNLWNRLPLAAKITLPICIVLVIGLAASTAVNAVKVSGEMMAASMALGREASDKGEGTVALRFQTGFRVARGLAANGLALKARHGSREDLANAVLEASAANPDLVGAWFEFAPDAFDAADAQHAGQPITLQDARGRVSIYATFGDGTSKLQDNSDPTQDINTQEYFATAFTTGADAVSEPYAFPVDGKDILMTSLAVPIIENGKTIGVAGVDIALDHLNEELGRLKPLGDGSVYLISAGGTWVSYKKPEWLGKSVKETEAKLLAPIEKTLAGAHSEFTDYSESLQTTVYRLLNPVQVTPTGKPWVLMTNLVGTTIEAPTRSIVLEGIVTAVILTLLLVAAMILLIRLLAAKPVRQLADTIGQLAKGETDTEVPLTGRGDELGIMGKAIEFFRQKLIEVEDLRRKTLAAEQEAAEARRRGMLELADTFESSVKGVVQTVSASAVELEANAQSMTQVAEKATAQSVAVSAATTECSSNVSTVAAASEEMSASIAEISRQVTESSTAARSAVGETNSAAHTVEELAKAAEEIGDIVRLIGDISSQTNLLALNATIEAARAGEAGKGFAVVAAEVKGLANQTGKATEEITQRIQRIQSATGSAVKAMETVRSTISKVEAISTAIASAVEEQSAATREISGNAAQAAVGTEEVARNVDGVRAAAGEAGSAASQVLDASGELAKQAEALRREVDTFIARVRAG